MARKLTGKQIIIIGVALVAVVIVSLGLLAFGSRTSQQSSENAGTNQASSPSEAMDMPAGSMESTESNVADTPKTVATDQVEINDYNYIPKFISVKVGQTVTWTNKDSVSHNVMADTASSTAPSGALFGRDQTFTYTFTKAGTYTYHCDPHPYMKGTVVVTD